MPTTHVKTENLSCRISPEHKALIEQAARQSGYSVSDFVVHTLVAAASDLLQDESVIRLSKEEWARLTTSLERPARQPGEASRRAARLFREGHDEGDRQVWEGE